MPGGAGTVRWILTDPVLATTFEFPINPNTGGTPNLQKNLNFTNTAGPAGRVLAYEGRDAHRQVEVTGTILEQTMLDDLEFWYNKRYQLTLTDDLGRSYEIYITGFAANRTRSALFIYKHEYTLSYIVVDW